MILGTSVASISALLLLGLASLCGVNTEGVALLGKVLGWTAAISTFLWLFGAGMEIFMAYYSGVFVNGVRVESRRLRRLIAPLVMHGTAILACVPAVRQDAGWLVGACLVSLAGVIWQRRILRS